MEIRMHGDCRRRVTNLAPGIPHSQGFKFFLSVFGVLACLLAGLNLREPFGPKLFFIMQVGKIANHQQYEETNAHNLGERRGA